MKHQKEFQSSAFSSDGHFPSFHPFFFFPWKNNLYISTPVVLKQPKKKPTLFFSSLQNQIHSKLIGRNEQERSALQDRLQMLANQNKALQSQLSEMKRKQAELDCKVRTHRGSVVKESCLAKRKEVTLRWCKWQRHDEQEGSLMGCQVHQINV